MLSISIFPVFKTLNTKSVVQKEYYKELCFQTPLIDIKTPCGIGKYKYNKIGYDKDHALILEYTLIKDRKYTDTPNIMYKLGKYFYLSAEQVLYAFKYFANS